MPLVTASAVSRTPQGPATGMPALYHPLAQCHPRTGQLQAGHYTEPLLTVLGQVCLAWGPCLSCTSSAPAGGLIHRLPPLPAAALLLREVEVDAALFMFYLPPREGGAGGPKCALSHGHHFLI